MIGVGRLIFIKNAVSNIMNGMVAAILSIVLPHFFVHDFSPPLFASWILILQLGNLVNIFNFGLSVAVGRYVAVAVAKQDRRDAERVIVAGGQLLGALAALGGLAIIAVSLSIPYLFHQIAPDIVSETRVGVLWVGASFALGLPFSALSGGLIGLQRNEIPAAINVIGKTASGIAMVFVAARTHSLVPVCETLFFVSLMTYGLQFLTFRVVWGPWLGSLMSGLGTVRRELVLFCAGIAVWSIAMFFVTGVDTAIVGTVDFKAVAAYGLAANFSVFFAGSVNVALNPMIQIFAKHYARGDERQNLLILRRASSLCTTALFLAGCWLVGFEHYGFSLWVGTTLADQAFVFFAVLVIANSLRNSTTPYSLYLIGTGQQNKVVLTPVCEAAANFLFSIALSRVYGADGVAMGALIGAIVCVAANFLYNFKRTTRPDFDCISMFYSSLFIPLVCTIPVLLVLAVLWPCRSVVPLCIFLAMGSAATCGLAYVFFSGRGGVNVAAI